MFNILDVLKEGFSDLNTLIGFTGSLVTIFDHFKNKDGTHIQETLDAIRENGLDADIIFACGPTPMLRAIKEFAKEKKIACYISLEERMACGIGACLGCVCRTKERDPHTNVHNARICKDGPVFLSTEVEI